MANRICLGKRANDYGLYVSQSGIDVLTATTGQMLYSSDIPSFQIVQTGYVSVANNSTGTNIVIPNLGYYPLIVFFCRLTDGTPNSGAISWTDIGIQYNSFTSVTLYLDGNMSDDGTLTYGVTRIPITNV